MLNLSSIMVGSAQPQVMREFYEKVLNKAPDMADESWAGWQLGGCYFNVGLHSEVSGQNKEPARILLNFETEDVKREFERIKAAGATVIKEPYQMSHEPEGWVATFADPDGNYFQLMSPWEAN
jgi:predicted enzyme related to lactoylglutathione lyase